MSVLTAILIAAVLAVATDLATGWLRALLRFVSRAARRLLARWRPALDDNATIDAGWIRVDSGSWPRVHLHLRCAPSLRWDTPARMDRDGFYRFVHRVAPGVFPHEADYSVPDELIRFTSTTHERDQVFACALPTGVVEVSITIDHRDGPGGPVLPLLAIATFLARFHGEIASGAFQRVFGTSPKRVDWLLNLSPSVERGDYQRTEWEDFDFPGRRPSGRASGMRPPIDPRGYGRNSSRSQPLGEDVDVIARLLLTDLLERNGYRGFDGAIDDTLVALQLKEPEHWAVS